MNSDNKCYIVGAGEYFGHKITPTDSDYVIAADGGYLYLQEQGTRIDMIIGDFDSLSSVPAHPNVVMLPREKDDTDMMAAILNGLKKGYSTFHMFGGTGGRLDHTIANIQCLAFLSSKGAKSYLYGNGYVITSISDGCIEFDKDVSGYISVFSHSNISKGISITGMKYNVDECDLKNTYPLGVSNEFAGVSSKISVRQGTLIIVYPQN